MVLIFYVFLLVSSLPQTIAIIVIDQQSALYRQQNKVISHGNFQPFVYSSLVVTKITSIRVEKQSECPFKCINEPICYSCNVATYTDSEELYLCELLATDKYREKTNFHDNATFHHFSPRVSSATML